MNPVYIENLLAFLKRILCKTTYRRSFPVSHQSHIELPVGVIESFLVGDISGIIPFYYVHRALAIHNKEPESGADDIGTESGSEEVSDNEDQENSVPGSKENSESEEDCDE